MLLNKLPLVLAIYSVQINGRLDTLLNVSIHFSWSLTSP
jgi:hypothetical protein